MAIIGPSGAGKSTVLSLAAGLVLPTSGIVETLTVDTREFGRRAHRGRRNQVGSVRQDFALVGPLRVAQNVAAGRLGRGGFVAALRMLVRPRDLDGIRGALRRVGIEDRLWDRTDRLSGGQQQRVAVARVLYQDPLLILADEPLSALDPARSSSVLEELFGGPPEMAVVASLHDADLALRCSTRVIGLRSGVVVFDADPSEVSAAMLADLYALGDERQR